MKRTSAKPVRMQLSRRRGFRLQRASRALNGLEAVNVARPSRWGNPFVFQFDPHPDYSPQTREEAVDMFKRTVTSIYGQRRFPQWSRKEIIKHLRNKNLACWCPPGEPCHADVLLAISNGCEYKVTRAKKTKHRGKTIRTSTSH